MVVALVQELELKDVHLREVHELKHVFGINLAEHIFGKIANVDEIERLVRVGKRISCEIVKLVAVFAETAGLNT